jgi:hypothetical protein
MPPNNCALSKRLNLPSVVIADYVKSEGGSAVVSRNPDGAATLSCDAEPLHTCCNCAAYLYDLLVALPATGVCVLDDDDDTDLPAVRPFDTCPAWRRQPGGAA